MNTGLLCRLRKALRSVYHTDTMDVLKNFGNVYLDTPGRLWYCSEDNPIFHVCQLNRVLRSPSR